MLTPLGEVSCSFFRALTGDFEYLNGLIFKHSGDLSWSSTCLEGNIVTSSPGSLTSLLYDSLDLLDRLQHRSSTQRWFRHNDLDQTTPQLPVSILHLAFFSPEALILVLAGIGSSMPSSPIIFAPVPRRATNDTILSSETDDDKRYTTPPQCTPPGALNRQLSLNRSPNTQNHHSPGGGNVHTPRHGHSRNSSWGSVRNSLSPSPKKTARISPEVIALSPSQLHSPLPRGATPNRSAMRPTPSPARTSPLSRYPAHSPGSGSVPQITITEATPPSPISPTSGGRWPPGRSSNQPVNAGRSGVDGDDEGATPGQRIFESRLPSSGNLQIGAPLVRGRTPSEPGHNDSGYSGHHPSVSASSHARMPATQSQSQSQRTGNTTSHQNWTSTSGSGTHTSWQPPHSLPTCPPIIPSSRSASVNSSRSHANPASFLDPGRPPHAVPTSARPTSRLTNRNLAPINTSFGQFDGRPRSSQSRSSQHAIPHGPARNTVTPTNGNDIGSVVNDLLRVPPTSASWQTSHGVLTWTPHPALPGSGLNLPGRGSENGSGGRGGNGDWLTGGYPMPGACPDWTPGVWPPAATPRGTLIQLAPWMIPNPCNAALPHIMWDISQLPTTAKRITGNHVIVSVMDKLDDLATHPAVDRLVVACQVGVAENFWGHIEVKASRPKGVTVWDVFSGIFEYFQKRVGKRELKRMKEMSGDERLEEKLTDAFYQRIRTTPALPGYELKGGLKRVDCLGDGCFFWGLYVSYNNDNTWQLNLGLVNRRRDA